MGLWKCTKCGNTTAGANKPLVGSCVKGGGHRWKANDGNRSVVYRCGKCGNTTMSLGKPNDRPCVRGGRCTWRKQN